MDNSCFTEPKDCDDGNPCTTDSCDISKGGCVNVWTCEDNNPCTIEFCDNSTGECLWDFACPPDGDPCTSDFCTPIGGGAYTCDYTSICTDGGECCAGGAFCCGVDEQCCNESCIPTCIDKGSLSGGTVDVSADPVCIDDTITFTASGVVDSGGIERVQCVAKQGIPGVTPSYTWEITKPDATIVSGSGSVATVIADEPGTYSCEFTASANRNCPPDDLVLSLATASTVSDYETISIQYKTFIRCDFIEAVWPSPAWPFFSGDGRVFGQNGSNRTLQTTQVTVDPLNTSGEIGTPSQQGNISNGYITLTERPPPYTDWCDRLCRFSSNPDQTPSCSELSPGGYQIIHERINNEIVKVRFKIFARAGCSTFLTPSIDSDVSVFVKQTCSAGVLDSVFVRFEGHMDAFPWHEIIVGGAHVAFVDPCLMITDGNALLGPDDAVIVNTIWGELVTNP